MFGDSRWANMPQGAQRTIGAFHDLLKHLRTSIQGHDFNFKLEEASELADTLAVIRSKISTSLDTNNPGDLNEAIKLLSEYLRPTGVARDRRDFTNLLAQMRAQHSESLNAARNEFSGFLNGQTRFLDSSREDARRSREELESEAQELVKKLRAHEDSARAVSAAIGAKGVASNYSAVVIAETKEANLYRWITLGLFAIGITLVSWITIYSVCKNISLANPLEFLARVAIGVLVSVPALYTGRESARHRTVAQTARQTIMELETLGPFIADLDPELRESIRRDLVSKYFGRQVTPHTVSVPIAFKDVKELTVELAKAMNEKKK